MSSAVLVEDSDNGYQPHLFSIPRHYEKCVSSVLLSYGLIKDRIEKLAEEIMESYGNEDFLVCVCILKGAFRFYCDLMQHLKISLRHSSTPLCLDFEFLQLSSYRNDETTGSVSFLSAKSIFQNFVGKNVLIVEDIIESGNTMVALLDSLKEFNCKSVKVASLLVKRSKNSCGYKPDFTGFDIPDKFVIGYGLDYNEFFRDMDHICIISEEGKKMYRK